MATANLLMLAEDSASLGKALSAPLSRRGSGVKVALDVLEHTLTKRAPHGQIAIRDRLFEKLAH